MKKLLIVWNGKTLEWRVDEGISIMELEGAVCEMLKKIGTEVAS